MAGIDPNKYSKNKDINPNSLMSNILAFVRMGLMLLGLVGIAFELFSDESWLKSLLSKLFSSTTNMMLIPLIIVGLWLVGRIINGMGEEGSNKGGDLPLYIMMGFGLFYLFKLATTGGL